MEMILRAVLVYLCINVSAGDVATYKSAVATGNFKNGLNDFLPKINEANKQKADIVLLSTEIPNSEICSDSTCGPEHYDELARGISDAAKKYNFYIASHLYERVRCEGKEEIVRGNYVFDRKGSVVSVYKKPINNYAVCNTTFNDMPTFSTDFGVDFMLLMNDDIISQEIESGKIRNFIVTGGSKAGITYVKENQLISSLAYVANANIISDSGIYGSHIQNGLVQEISKDGVQSNKILSTKLALDTKPVEDLNQYVIKPLDVEASIHGYSENVCHEEFCCEFYVKTKDIDASNGLSYGFAVFDGTRQIGSHFVGVESCKLVACATQDKKCDNISNCPNTYFDKIIITGNFTKEQSTQFPVILTEQTSLSSDSFSFAAKSINDVKQVTMMLSDAKNIFKFGILGHNYLDDSHNSNNTDVKSQYTSDFYEYIFNEDVFEFFDSVWIKLRILLLIVSVYILEMM